LPDTTVQQLVPELRFLTSVSVSSIRSLLTLAAGAADFVGVGVFEAVTVALGVGVVLTTFVLLQITFLPDLTQKYLTPPVVLVDPTLLHLVPAMVAA
jgi:hypothetical protein